MVRSAIQAWMSDTRGGILVMLGLSLPVLGLGTAAAMEYGMLVKRRMQLQVASDNAVTAGANELKLANADDERVLAVVKAVVEAQTRTTEARAKVIAGQVMEKRRTVQVKVTETVPSLMGKLLSLPTMDVSVTAAATLIGSTRLCGLALDTNARGSFHLEKNARMTANGCSLYSNSSDAKGLQGEHSAVVQSLLTCSAGGFDGKKANFTPQPTTGCPVIADPLASRPAPPIGTCIGLSPNAAAKQPKKGVPEATVDPLLDPGAGENLVTASITLGPGTYCGGLHVSKDAQVTLNPGIYVMKDGPFVVDGKANVTGQNVAFYFTGDKGGMRLDKDTTISLTAPRDGVMAGFLFSEDKIVNAPVAPPPGLKGKAPVAPGGDKPLREYRIISDNARMMLGTFYLPVGRLVIDSNSPVADRSAYTVIVAQQINLYEGPNLYLNSDYSGTNIPVPQGVGPTTGSVALSK